MVVYRRVAGGLEFLILHRAHSGPEFEGDWAWTPPSGARLPHEPILACAQRELAEETGLKLDLVETEIGTERWAVYLAEASDEPVTLDAEHDRYEWCPPDEALARCQPQVVSDQLREAASRLA